MTLSADFFTLNCCGVCGHGADQQGFESIPWFLLGVVLLCSELCLWQPWLGLLTCCAERWPLISAGKGRSARRLQCLFCHIRVVTYVALSWANWCVYSSDFGYGLDVGPNGQDHCAQQAVWMQPASLIGGWDSLVVWQGQKAPTHPVPHPCLSLSHGFGCVFLCRDLFFCGDAGQYFLFCSNFY